MRRHVITFSLPWLLLGPSGIWCAGAATTSTVVFLETMAATAAKPWTGGGCNNPWTMSFNGSNPFEQATGWNYGAGNPCGMQFKQGTTNLTDSMITATPGIAAIGDAAYVEFYLSADGLTANTGWTFQLDAGSGYVTRLSELTGANHAWQLYHYDLQAGERVSNLHLRFQFAGGTAADRINLDQISVTVVTATTTPNPSAAGSTPSASGRLGPHPRRQLPHGRPLRVCGSATSHRRTAAAHGQHLPLLHGPDLSYLSSVLRLS